MNRDIINTAVSKMFRGYDKEFVNELARLLNLYHHDFYINNPKRLAMFLSHGKAEVDVHNGKVLMRESMNYTPKRLIQIFKWFRHHAKEAYRLGRTRFHKADQEAIANRVYARRLGNGDVYSGDGWKFRGDGFLQSTGKANLMPELKFIEEKTGIKVVDEHGKPYDALLNSYTGGILLGMADWYRSKMYAAKTMDESTRIINRYTDSYAKRRRYYAQAMRIIDQAFRYA